MNRLAANRSGSGGERSIAGKDSKVTFQEFILHPLSFILPIKCSERSILRMKYAVGIDLGTTNSALAYIPLKGAGDRPNIETFPVPQLIDVGEFGKKSLLPSFAYIPGEHE